MMYVEVAVNVPIRRTFGRGMDAPPEPAFPDEASSLQTYHYHLAPELEARVAPGHLVWVPFGSRELQGVVIALTPSAPVPTKAVARLARPEPVLNTIQLELAAWIADYYVAPFAEAIKLFLPPGLLAKEDGSPRVRAKRELRVRLALPPDVAEARLATIGKTTQAATLLAWLLSVDGGQGVWRELREQFHWKARKPLDDLLARNLIQVMDDTVTLTAAAPVAQAALLQLRGSDRYQPIIAALAAAGGVLWKSELPAAAGASLEELRTLRTAGIITLDEEIRFRDPLGGRSYPPTTAPTLTGAQTEAWGPVELALEAAQAGAKTRPFLLFGVTGSGKTEIYLHAIEQVLGVGRQAIVLVPEIALTPQTVGRFAARFPGRVTVIHSELSSGERYDVWRAIRDGLVDVVVGPRSALFAPLPRLGLIVIDEEHESTYKQDAEEWGSNKVFYDARRVAQRLAEISQSVLILGSATPGIEAFYAAERGEFALLSLPKRVVGHRIASDQLAPIYGEMPPVEIIDMRQELRAGNRSIFSRILREALLATLDAGEQAILFLNRRGSRTFIMCRDCGHVARCPRCDTSLTYHEGDQKLMCHRCNRRLPVPVLCPQCNGKRIKHFGIGTERVVESLRELAPSARVLRWDADSTSQKGAHEELLRAFTAHEADLLVGTQMIAKGLDLPLVTLVGAIAADTGLFLPDFRSGERTFQLLSQVAGRAGRSERGGRVVFQTYRPEHHAIRPQRNTTMRRSTGANWPSGRNTTIHPLPGWRVWCTGIAMRHARRQKANGWRLY
ncbi:MAG: primosomal protein N' [Anaerolineales bacterium]|nr:primosomal protein N' [Anaerolineales bacterium]